MMRTLRLRAAVLFLMAATCLSLLVAAAPPSVGATAPDFRLQDTAGHAVELSSLRGEALVLHFWASWCPHCLAEMPLLDQMHRELAARGVRVLAINLGERPGRVNRYLKEHGLELPVLLDSRGKVAEAYGVVGLPASFLVDPEGRIVQRVSMGSLDREALEALVAPYVSGAKGKEARRN